MSSFIVRKAEAVQQRTKTIIDGLFQKDEWTKNKTASPGDRAIAENFNFKP